jgi:porin
MKNKIFLLALIFQISLITAFSEEPQEKQEAFTYSASYTGDGVGNFTGGIKTGVNYLGVIHFGLGFNTEKAKWWKGGEFKVDFMNTHGDEPSANLIGDLQTASNIEAGNLSVLYELWYKHTLGNFNITLGLQDLNANFVATENGSLFINSSFGVHTVMSENISLPIFPITALGANLQWNITDKFNWQTAVFDGTPNSRNPYNTNWIIGKKDGYLLVTEFQWEKSLINNLSGCYKLGGYYHNHDLSESGAHENGGIYLIADQDLTKKLSGFMQIGLSPNSINDHNHFYSLGFNYKNFCKKRPDDKIGLAASYIGIDNSIRNETAMELTYYFKMNDHIFIQPDIQYIIHPSGTGVKLDNALVGILRLGIEI